MERQKTLGGHLDAGRNGIGALRLLLAFLVLFSHAWPVGGFGLEPLVGFGRNDVTLGTLSVVGFFVLSGILIARSWTLHPKPLAFLRNRALRILPGFWVCLIVSAFVIAPICWWSSRSTFAGFPITGSSSAVGYIVSNSALYIRQAGIVGTLNGAVMRFPPPAGVLNGSLWTLFFEAVCYVAVFVLGIAGLLQPKRRAIPVLLAAALLALLVVFVRDHVSVTLPLQIEITHYQVRVLAAFAIGVVMFCFADRIPLGWPWFLGAVALSVWVCAAGWLNYGGLVPVAYVIIWIGLRNPIRGLEGRDLSYGVYLYAFPIQQLLAIRSWNRWGIGVYLLLTVVLVGAVAAGSWFLVERPFLRLKASRSRVGLRATRSASPEEQPVSEAIALQTEA